MAHADECPYLWWMDDEGALLEDLVWRIRVGALTEPALIAGELERMIGQVPEAKRLHDRMFDGQIRAITYLTHPRRGHHD